MVKKIALTRGEYALVDDEDFDFINQYEWKFSISGKTGYARRFEKGRTIYLHRFILNPKNKEEIDHINGNGLDNRRINLRVVTFRQNQQNKHVKKTSNFPGVFYDKFKNKWRSQISINRKRTNVGYFNSELEAFESYKKAVYNLTGEKVVCENKGNIDVANSISESSDLKEIKEEIRKLQDSFSENRRKYIIEEAVHPGSEQSRRLFAECELLHEESCKLIDKIYPL